MIIDSLLQLSEAQAATGDSTNTIDFGQKSPNSGLADERLYLVVTAKEGWAAADTLKVEIQHSDQETTAFATIADSGVQDFGKRKQVIMPMPITHKRYVKAKYTATGSGAKKVDAQIVTGLQLNIVYPESPRVKR